MSKLIDVVGGVFGVHTSKFVAWRDHVILFGLDIAHHEQDGELEHEILLYPKGCIIHGTDIRLGITKDLQNTVMCGWLGLPHVFQQVYFVIGSPNYELYLLGVGVFQAGV